MDKNFIDIKLGNTRYVQRRENSKIIACNENDIVIQTYMLKEELPPFVQDELVKIKNIELHPEDYFTYEKGKYGGIKIINFNNSEKVKNLFIPEKIDGYTVTDLGHIFYMDRYVNKIIMGNNIKHIDQFFCYNANELKEVNLSSKIIAIPDSAFMDCFNLEKINLEMVEIVDVDAFRGCGTLKKINLNSLAFIRDNAFRDCCEIEEINLPKIESMGSSVFADCTGLKSITTSAHLHVLGFDAFRGCCSLEKFDIPESLCEIPMSCFENCTLLSDVYFPDTLEYISSSAFARTNLSGEITFSQNLRKISSNAFEDCNFSRINVYTKTNINEAFSFQQKLKLKPYNDVTLYLKKITIER